MTKKMFLKNIVCKLWRHDLMVDTDKFKATCRRCRRLFQVSYDMLYGETIIENEIDCGEYNCNVDEKYGFVPEAGCPKHN